MTALPDAPGRRRAWLMLDGLWDFSFEGPAARLAGDGHSIRSPGIWQTQFPALRTAQGAGRYRRRIDIPQGWAGQRIVLVMEGVFHEAVILVDETPVATHGDGWTPIEVDLTDALDGKASFVLGVDARTPDDRNGGRFSRSLAGKQDWYGVQGGIWKPARLEARDPVHLSEIEAQSSYDLATGTVTVMGRLSQPAAGTLRLALSRARDTLAHGDFPLDGATFLARLTTPNPEPWSPDAPNLYDVAIELIRGGVVIDAVERTVGFRRFDAKDGRLVLNGRPFTMFGALDQDWHPEEECRAPDPQFLEQRFVNAKAMGVNTLRCHVKIPDRLYFDLADRLGLIVWLDMPYMQFLAPETRKALRDVFRTSVATHGHHPSITIWTLFNEGWGIDLDDNPDDRRWLVETFDAAKALVPNGLVVDNSPCFPRNYHLKTDIEDFHWYNGFPHQNEAFAATARAFAGRAPWPWSPHGDAQRRGDEPLICSEFGVWGLPHPGQILEKDGSEPWWFESGHDWNRGAAYPHGIETRFRDAQLAPIFGDVDGFANAAQEFQYRALKYQIETLRWERPICGYVITELNDTQWESNGLMDVRNRPRAFADRLANLQRPWLVIARAPRTAIRVGETLEVSVRLAGAQETPAGARLAWRFGDQAGAASLGAEPTTITLAGATAQSIAIAALELEARDDKGRLLSRNALEFCVVPALAGARPSLFATDPAARALLGAVGWPNCAAGPEESEIALATRLTTPVRESLIAGRNVLLIANSAEALVDPGRDLPLADRHNFPSMLLRARDGTPWDGEWMGAFSWRRIDGPWVGLPNGPMLDEHWVGLMPKYVLTGFPSTAFGGLIDSGMAVGWLHLAAAFAKRSFLGKASLTVSTFDLTSGGAAENPLARHLLAALAGS
jgi:Glycosyl hydrolases family 2/Glycosyl hydrolases family 2, sugar binding domain/Glycosyl hydrolases family 2, TIM barrel domain